ncbi:MAG: aminotransferase class IV [Pedobacter sp.]
MIVNLDGTFIADDQTGLPVDDGAILFGDTLFETIKVRHNTILLAEAHLDRIQMSAALLDFPCDRDAIRTAQQQTAKQLPWPVARMRLTLSRGRCKGLQPPPKENARTLITASAYVEPDENQIRSGANCVFAPNRRVNPLSHLPQMKRGNYADCLYAARFAQAKGAREALFCNDEGHVLEGATSNLFIVKDNILITPEAGEVVLAGIMRRHILQIAKTLGLATEERPISKKDLILADEAFLSNALIDIMPIARIEATEIKRGKQAIKLLQKIRESTNHQIK